MMNHILLIKKVISMTLIFDFDMHAFLDLGDSAVFYCMLCLFVLGLYWKTQVSSPVIICLRIFESSLIFSSMFSQKFTQFCFWSSDKILGTILAHTFCIPRSCSKIVCTDSLFRLSSSDIIHTVNLRSLCTSSFTLVMFSSLLFLLWKIILSWDHPPLPCSLSQNVCPFEDLCP